MLIFLKDYMTVYYYDHVNDIQVRRLDSAMSIN